MSRQIRNQNSLQRLLIALLALSFSVAGPFPSSYALRELSTAEKNPKTLDGLEEALKKQPEGKSAQLPTKPIQPVRGPQGTGLEESPEGYFVQIGERGIPLSYFRMDKSREWIMAHDFSHYSSSVVQSPDARWLFKIDPQTKKLVRVDPQTEQVVAYGPTGVERIALTKDGTVLYADRHILETLGDEKMSVIELVRMDPLTFHIEAQWIARYIAEQKLPLGGEGFYPGPISWSITSDGKHFALEELMARDVPGDSTGRTDFASFGLRLYYVALGELWNRFLEEEERFITTALGQTIKRELENLPKESEVFSRQFQNRFRVTPEEVFVKLQGIAKQPRLIATPQQRWARRLLRYFPEVATGLEEKPEGLGFRAWVATLGAGGSIRDSLKQLDVDEKTRLQFYNKTVRFLKFLVKEYAKARYPLEDSLGEFSRRVLPILIRESRTFQEFEAILESIQRFIIPGGELSPYYAFVTLSYLPRLTEILTSRNFVTAVTSLDLLIEIGRKGSPWDVLRNIFQTIARVDPTQENFQEAFRILTKFVAVCRKEDPKGYGYSSFLKDGLSILIEDKPSLQVLEGRLEAVGKLVAKLRKGSMTEPTKPMREGLPVVIKHSLTLEAFRTNLITLIRLIASIPERKGDFYILDWTNDPLAYLPYSFGEVVSGAILWRELYGDFEISWVPPETHTEHHFEGYSRGLHEHVLEEGTRIVIDRPAQVVFKPVSEETEERESGLEEALTRTVLEWKMTLVTPPSTDVAKRLLPVFYAPETFQAVPLVAKSGLPFMVLVSSDQEEAGVRLVLDGLLVPKEQYLVRQVPNPKDALTEILREFSDYATYPVDPILLTWLEDLLARLRQEGVMPLGDVGPALQATEQYFATLA